MRVDGTKGVCTNTDMAFVGYRLLSLLFESLCIYA